MKKKISNALAACLLVILSLGFFVGQVYAEENSAETKNTSETTAGTSIRLSPANLVVNLPSDTVIENKFEIKNEGDSEIKVEVYASPYSYVYSEEEDQYKLGFSKENNYTQLSHWMTFEDTSGNYVEKPVFTIGANEKYYVNYKIKTPTNMPSGGQYAVIFTHALTSVTSGSGIRTEASPGIVVYGHSTEGENIVSTNISNLKIEKGITEANVTRNNIYATAKVKNNGNVDFVATGLLKVEPIIGFSSYNTSEAEDNVARVSVIPEVEMNISNEWKETPGFGIYKATWIVSAGDQTETTERIFFLFSPIALIGVIILLTFLTIWIIMSIRRRKERRSRLAV
ncbi:hypothetical protein IKG10_01430 [Candidatus Saccharibacteria bacterium]|nr:hypothetical protein [Candidatus Saccharibacteria bacterium]